MDMKKLYASEKHAELFPWSEDDIVVKTFKAANAGMSFDRLLNTKDISKIRPFLEKHRVQDGLVVFYYDRKNELLKTFKATDFKVYEEKHWRPDEMLMVNHQNGKSTRLTWENYHFKNGFRERDFDQSSLARAR